MCITTYDEIIGVLIDMAVSVDITSNEWYIAKDDEVNQSVFVV